MRSGTTWVHEYLSGRSDVSLPGGTKETYFFDRSFDRGAAWYARHFPATPAERRPFVIEVGPSYLHAEQAPARVRQVLGDVRLVVIARNPVQRSWSHYVHLKRFGLCRGTLREAVRTNSEIVDASRYAYQLERWGAVMNRLPTLVCFDELADSPATFARAVCAGLDMPFALANADAIGTSNRNAASPSPRLASLAVRASYWLRDHRMYGLIEFGKRLGLRRLVYGSPRKSKLPDQPTPEESEWLVRQLHPDLDRLQDLLGRDFSHWRTA
jgi:hypothetical protein